MVNITRFKQRVQETLLGSTTGEANKLANLRKQRLKVEGHAKMINIRKKEEARIKKAKQTIKDNGKIATFVKGVKEISGEIKKSKKKDKNNPWRNQGSENSNPWR